MKKLIFTTLTLSLMFSCYQGPTVEFDDEKSQAVAAIFDAINPLFPTPQSITFD